MDFKAYLKQYQELINNELEKYSRDVNVIEGKLNEAIKYSLLGGGKRLRPILMLATFELFSNEREKCMTYAIAMEMIHNCSLIHDDLPGIDNDDFRHGKPTNHKQFGEATAILAGDSLLNNAYKIIAEDMLNYIGIDLENRIKAFKEISNGVDKMIIGEHVDTEFEGKVGSEAYLDFIHENKTAALLIASIRVGATLGKADNKSLDILTEYAKKIGLAFQIKDDILSVEGDEKVLGKPVGNDKEKGKFTYITKYGLEKSKDILENLINDSINDLEKVETKNETNIEFLKELAIYIKTRNK